MKGPSRAEVWKMFDAISSTYDGVNRAMTFSLDRRWRKKVATFLPSGEKLTLLDCATGTGDQLISLMEACPRIERAVGIDLAPQMLEIAKQKVAKKPYVKKVELQIADATALPYPDQAFDCVTISFGIRNVTDVPRTLAEFYRVLKSGGKLLILETSLPTNRLFKACHLFYLRHLLPRLGSWLSGHKEAYRYLNQTIETFPSGPSFCSLLHTAGFPHPAAHPLTLGTVTLYSATK